ncbi:retroelement silencing factor 1-like [Ambystoma mexicanum]|uniref:retroelement silencing factor 1-like n=1 Tax=Ambystoma mexicanum TaxID=8296 RepID=UPI0037E803B7
MVEKVCAKKQRASKEKMDWKNQSVLVTRQKKFCVRPQYADAASRVIGPSLSSQTGHGTLQNMPYAHSQQYRTPTNYPPSMYQQFHNSARYVRDVHTNQPCSIPANEKQLEHMQQHYYTLQQLHHSQHMTYPNVHNQATFTDAQGVLISGQKSNLQALPPYPVHADSQMTFRVQNPWPAEQVSAAETNVIKYNPLRSQQGLPLPKEVEYQRQLAMGALKPMHPQQVSGHRHVQNVLGSHQPQNIATEKDFLTVNGGAYASRIGNERLSPYSGPLKAVPTCTQEFTRSKVPASEPHVIGNIPDCTDGVKESLDHASNPMDLSKATGNSEVTGEQIAQLHKKLMGTKDDYMSALWDYKEKYELFKSSGCNTNLSTSNVQVSNISQNVCDARIQAKIWPVPPHVASTDKSSAAPVPGGIAYKQSLMQTRASQEANCFNLPSMPNTEGLHSLGNIHQGFKAFGSLSRIAPQHAWNKDDSNPSVPFSNFLINKYLMSLHKKNVAVGCTQESYEQPKAVSLPNNGIKSEPIDEETESSFGNYPMCNQFPSADATKLQSNIQQQNANSILQDWSRNVTEKGLINGKSPDFQHSAQEQNCISSPNDKIIDTFGKEINLVSSDLKCSYYRTVNNEIISESDIGEVTSPQAETVYEQTSSDLKQSMLSLVDLLKTTIPNAHCSNNPPFRNAVCASTKNSQQKECPERTLTGYKPEPLGLNMKKSAEPQIAVVNPLIQSKCQSIEQDDLPLQKEIYRAAHGNIQDCMPHQNGQMSVDIAPKVRDDHLSSTNKSFATSDSAFGNSCANEGKTITNVSPTPFQSSTFSQPETNPKQLLRSEVKHAGDEECCPQLMITSVCSLAAGNTFYDSQIADIFENSPLTPSKLGVMSQSKTENVTKRTVHEIRAMPVHQRLEDSVTQPKSLFVDNKSVPVESCNDCDNKVVVAVSKPQHGREQTHPQIIGTNEEMGMECKKTANEHTLTPVITQSQNDHSINEGKKLAEQMPAMAGHLLEESAYSDDSYSEPYLNSQLSELLRMFPFGIERMEGTAILNENEVIESQGDDGQDGTLLLPECSDSEKKDSKKKEKYESSANQMMAQLEGDGIVSSLDTCSVSQDPTNNANLKCGPTNGQKELQINNNCHSISLDLCHSEMVSRLNPLLLTLLNPEQSTPRPPEVLTQTSFNPNMKYTEDAKGLTTQASPYSEKNSLRLSVHMDKSLSNSNLLPSVYEADHSGSYFPTAAVDAPDKANCSLIGLSLCKPFYTSNEDPLARDLPLTYTYPPVNHIPCNEGLSVSQNNRDPNLLSGPTKRKKKKPRLIVKTDFLKSRHSMPGLGRKDEAEKMSPKNDSIESMFSVGCLPFNEKKPTSEENITVADDVGSSEKENGPMEKRHAAESSSAEKELEPKVPDESVTNAKMCSVQEFFQRRKSEQMKWGKKMQKQDCVIKEKFAKRTVQHRKPLIPSGILKKHDRSDSETSEQNILQHPKPSDAMTSTRTVPETPKVEVPSSIPVNPDVPQKADGFSHSEYKSDQIIDHNVANSGSSTSSRSIGVTEKRKTPKKYQKTIGNFFLRRVELRKLADGSLQMTPIPSLPTKSAAKQKRNKVVEPTSMKPESPVLQHGSDGQMMLEFRLCPDELLGCHLADDLSGNDRPPASKKNQSFEEIKRKTNDCSNNIPLKKRKFDLAIFQGNVVLPRPSTPKQIMGTMAKTANCYPTSTSKVIFNAYKKLYLEIKSRDLKNTSPKCP